MTGLGLAVLAFFATMGITLVGDMVSEEVRDRLDHMPQGILRLAAARLDAGQRAVYEEEWLPELTYVLSGAETRPITRLITGTWFALGLLASARSITRPLDRPVSGQTVPALPTSVSLPEPVTTREFWTRYRQYLENSRLMPRESVRQLDEVTDKVLGMLGDPSQDGHWQHHGLVIAPPQSGEAVSCAGLACKAADAGYKLIMVLASNHNLMRRQIQMRVDEGFRLPGTEHSQLRVLSLTDSRENGDFKRWFAPMQTGDHTIVLVIKKNRHILRHVRAWVTAYDGLPTTGAKAVPSRPVLIIDTDARSPLANNVVPNSDAGVSRVRADVQRLLESFDRSAYVGFTTSPFSSLALGFRSGDYGPSGRVFSWDFIVSTTPSAGYLGAERVLGLQADSPGDSSGALPIVRIISDHGSWMPDGHRKDWFPSPQLPESLDEAISAFVLGCAARRARGQVNSHMSMLIHATRFARIQGLVASQVSGRLQLLGDLIRDSGTAATAERELRSLWEQDFASTSAAFRCSEMPTWERVWSQVQPAIEKILVQAVNRTTTHPLEYHEHRENGLSVIAVTGSTLPAGLILEGLTVSYYLQASGIPGTLQQVGRAFGYRPGYEDLCRLYATPELIEALESSTVAACELELGLRAMGSVHP